MNQNYGRVPNIITGKDLDYLSDMFTWNYGAFKKSSECISKISDMEIKNIITDASSFFNNNMNTILSILQEGGQNE